jgi:hypothetical protein
MLNRQWTARLISMLLLTALGAGLVWLTRFSSGTSYPMYSSLGTGETGTDLLFEALNGSGKITAVRNYLPLDQLRVRDTTVLYLGIHPTSLAAAEDQFFKELEDMARQGNRVVVGITSDHVEKNQKGKDQKKEDTKNRWRIRVSSEKPEYAIEPSRDWEPLPMIAAWERRFGPGTVILLSNADRLTNQSLAEDDSAREVVTILVGNRRTVIFEEAHLGVAETGSIAALARRYHLVGLMAGLLLLTAMFLWKNAIRFPPPATDEKQADAVVAARDSRSMLAGLLERHIAPDTLIEVCVAEWNRARPDKRLDSKAWIGQDPVAAYRGIREQFQRKKIR